MSNSERGAIHPDNQSRPEIGISVGDYHLTTKVWETISGQKAPEGIETVILGKNGEAVGWKDNGERVVLHEADTELDDHGWPKKGSEAARLWVAASNTASQIYASETRTP